MSKKSLNIAILDDSEFDNKLFSQQLKTYTNELAFGEDLNFNIQSFTTTSDFLNHLSNDTEVVILDYYLDEGNTGKELISKIKSTAECCKILIVSQARNVDTAMQTLRLGANAFIHKDDIYSMPRICFFVEEALKSKYQTS